MKDLHILRLWAFLVICLIALLFPAAFAVFLNEFFGIVGRFLAIAFVSAFILWALRRLLFSI